MKKILRIPLLLVAMLLSSIPLSAHDFEVDGIYYNITSSTDKTVAVTFCGSSYGTVDNDEYTGNVAIPETVTYFGSTYSVTSIGECAFYKCTGLTSVTIPNSVTTIGNFAFDGCTGLTSVTIGNSVTEIGSCAFRGCNGLTSVTIPNSVASIGGNAFKDCAGLTSVTLLNSVTKISDDAFYNTPWYNNQPDGVVYINNLLYKYKGTMPSGTSIDIKDGTVSINSCAFDGCTGLTSVTIGNSVTEIGSCAFRGCSGLTSVTIPNSVTTIGSSAFSGCTGLTSVTIPSSVTSIGSGAFYGTSWYNNQPDSVVYINNVLYKYKGTMPSGTSIEIKDGTVSISPYAFDDCTGLTSVTIPNSVTTIGSSAFEDCTGLTSVTIPNSVTTIGGYAFYGCDGLTSVSIPNSVTTIGGYAFEGCTSLTSVSIPNSVTTIGPSAFRYCTGLTEVTIPNTVTTIGVSAFEDCTGLTEVNITDLSAWCKINFNGSTSNPLYYASKLKLNGEEITNLIIPSDISEINSAFHGYIGLTSVTIPNSVTKIGACAFEYCTRLTDITIGNSVIEIGESAFHATPWYDNQLDGVLYISNVLYDYKGSMSSGTSIDIKVGTVSITRSAFSGCTGLISVIIPNSVTIIGSQAFYKCSNLATLSGGENLLKIGTEAFWGCDKLIDGIVVATTQTTATIRLTSPTQYNLGAYYSDNDKAQAANGVAKLTGLKPGSTISSYDLALIINGIYCPIKDFSFTTQSFSASISGSATATSISAIGTFPEGEVTILDEGINYGSSVTNYDGNNTITVNNLDPNTSYTIYYAVKIQEGGVYTASKSFTTGDLTWSNGGFTATSTSSARLSVETTCDATAGTGFEWKRYDAPESLAPSEAPCPVVDGMLVGSLRNLNPDVYYKCRPYYTSSSGNTYYGEWITFFTGDANVYFEPEVRTFSERSVVNNSVTVRGYALPGTDDISEQGFEYWKVPASRATSTVMTVKASGISMTATLADLEYNSTYRYRAYVKTSQGVFYGDEMEFATGEDPAGIGYIEVDSNNFDVMLRENPATATAWIKVAGTSAIEAEYYILTTNGGVVANGFIPADGEYQPIELNIAPGLYLMSVTDGSHRKTLRLIVR